MGEERFARKPSGWTLSVWNIQTVWKHSKSTGNDRIVLLVLADHAGDEERLAWPSVELMAKKANCAERTVQRSLKSLVDLGEIAVHATASARRPTIYRL